MYGAAALAISSRLASSTVTSLIVANMYSRGVRPLARAAFGYFPGPLRQAAELAPSAFTFPTSVPPAHDRNDRLVRSR